MPAGEDGAGVLGDEPGGFTGLYSLVGGILGDFRSVGGVGRCGSGVGVGGGGSSGSLNRQKRGLGVHRTVGVPEVAVEPVSVQLGRDVRQLHRIIFAVVDIEVRELLGQNIVAVFVLGIDRDIRSVRTDKMPAGEVGASVIGDKPAGAADLNLFIRGILGDDRGSGGGCGRRGCRGRCRRRCGCCGNLGNRCGRGGGDRYGGRAAGRSGACRRRTYNQRGAALIRVFIERRGVGKGRGVTADVGEVVGPGQVFPGDGETSGAAGRNQAVGLSAGLVCGLLHHHGIAIDNGLLLGIIGSGHLPVGALGGAAGPVNRDGGRLRILGGQTERAAMCKLLGIHAFEVHHVHRVLNRDDRFGSNIRVVFVQKRELRHGAGAEQHAADEAKNGKIQKSLFQNIQSSF